MYGDYQERPIDIVTWGDSGYETTPSQREYIKFEVQMTHRKEYDYSYPNVSVEQRTVYVDPSNGLVVFDVEAYEKWIEGKGINGL